MGRKRKVRATASSQGQGVCHDIGIDRFSTLPDELAHHILSFVGFRDLTRVGTVSKRCYKFYISAPSLYFDTRGDHMARKAHKMNCFDRFLHRRGDSKMQRLGVDLGFPASPSDKLVQVMTWINGAVRCNVEEISLWLYVRSDGPIVGLPPSIFDCGSLRSLLVCMWSSFSFKVPSLPCPNNLQCLDLSKVTIDEGFSKWISSSCKCIKKIKLKEVDVENLTIESSSLESFSFEALSHLCSLDISGQKLEMIRLKWEFSDRGSRSLHICAPNLKYLEWVGNLVSHPKLGKPLCLEKAVILLAAKLECVSDFHNAFEFLCSICSAKALRISDRTIEDLFGKGSMAAPIFDTSYLRIDTANIYNPLVPAMVSFMKGMSKLNTLDIKSGRKVVPRKQRVSGFNSKYWESQNLDFVNQLKDVTIEVSNGNNAWQLARYILEHALNLKKMAVFHLPKKKIYIINRLSNCKKVSSATIKFYEKEWT